MDSTEKATFDSSETRELTHEEYLQLENQNRRLVTNYQAERLEIDAKKHWDLFYKRNETRFFKDRHWTTREFEELVKGSDALNSGTRTMLEVGCGVGNLIFPLIEEGLDLFVYACDLSTKAIELVKSNALYSANRMKAFQADVTTDAIQTEIPVDSVDIITMIFVLSAIHPDKFHKTLNNLYGILRSGGIILFRDYGLYDMAQLRFKAGNKISDNFYMRQDGTRSYYFSNEELHKLFTEAGFEVITSSYIHRRTVNKKEGVDVPRIFVQARFRKPLT